MFEKLDVTRMAQALAAQAGSRQGLVAQNIANADTPGYRARDLPSFAEAYGQQTGAAMRQTRVGHLGAEAPSAARAVFVPGSPSPDGNTVSLEMEMARGVEIRQQHDMALSVYRSVSDIVRTSLGRAR
jgi:flagellar basal-body rod protein FlgB